MQPRSQWSFKTDLSQVDFARILKEGNEAAPGGKAKAIRVTVDGKVYTLVALELAILGPRTGKLLGWVPNMENPLLKERTDRQPFRSELGRVLVSHHDVSYCNPKMSMTSHVLYLGDVVKEHLDVVKTTVEVF